MWDWDFPSWCCRRLTPKPHPHTETLLAHRHKHPQIDAQCPSPAAMLTSWLNRRRRRYLLLILCSPILLPLLFATCPLLCAVELCFLICRRRRNAAVSGGDGRREGGDQVGLLERYLDDQLSLVVGSVGDENSAGEEECGVDVECSDSSRGLLQ